jgi:hypothetical protein
MSILYGEGLESGFERLQLEIMKKIPDQSIFAWRAIHPHAASVHGLLSPTPSYFKDSQFSVDALQASLRPFSVTNIGIQITLRLNLFTTNARSIRLWVAALRCWGASRDLSSDPPRIQILLQERLVKIKSGIRIFQRVLPDTLWTQNIRTRASSELVKLFVPSSDQIDHLERTGTIFPTVQDLRLKKMSSDDNTVTLLLCNEASRSDEECDYLEMDGEQSHDALRSASPARSPTLCPETVDEDVMVLPSSRYTPGLDDGTDLSM